MAYVAKKASHLAKICIVYYDQIVLVVAMQSEVYPSSLLSFGVFDSLKDSLRTNCESRHLEKQRHLLKDFQIQSTIINVSSHKVRHIMDFMRH